MNRKIRTAGICLVLAVWLLLTGFLWFGSRQSYTTSERRPLAQLPQLTGQSLLSGKFMPDFEDFTLDQFPLRDEIRQIKALFHYYVLNQKDNNGIYLVDGTVAKLEYPLNTTSVKYAVGRLEYVYEKYLAHTQCSVYASLVPDKGYFLAQANGYPALDYDAMERSYIQGLPWAQYVDIKPQLTGRDYYRTDTHWRQEQLLGVARSLCQAMGTEPPEAGDYQPVVLDVPFYGVYFGQAALPMDGEPLTVLESALLAGCTVTDPVTGKCSQVYDMEKTGGADLYEVFLSGAQPLLVVDNPQGQPGKELVIFRDSFGSALAPLLVQGYSKVTLVDIRYIHPDSIGDFVTFREQDVLFLYSSLILNSGRSLK